MFIRNFEIETHKWMCEVFGATIAANKTERAYRLFEECAELMQAADIPKEDLLKLIDYVYKREKGEVDQEAGGVMLTLAAFTNAYTFTLQAAALHELRRVNTNEVIGRIQRKFITKETGSPLPGSDAPLDESFKKIFDRKSICDKLAESLPADDLI